MLTLQEIRQLTDGDLNEELSKASRELIKLKMDLGNGYTKEIHSVKNHKQYIAQLKTVARENLTEKKTPNQLT